LDAQSQTVHIARQAIVDEQLRPFAYELLFRGENAAVSGKSKTQAVYHTAFLDGAIGDLSTCHPVFINCDTDCLLGELTSHLSPDKCGLEILETVEATFDILDAISKAKTDGFMISLDDWVPDDARHSLLPLATHVKIDLPAFDDDTLRECVAYLRSLPIIVIAEKIESEQQLAKVRALGITYYQGYFLDHPQVTVRRRLNSSSAICLRLLSLLAASASQREMVECIQTDPVLCHKLLRFVSSSSQGARSPIQSTQAAIVRVGTEGLRRFAIEVMSRATAEYSPTAFASILTTARFVQELCINDIGDPAEAFLGGLLSEMQHSLNLTLSEILDMLPLSQSLRSLLLDNDGPYASYLRTARDYQQIDEPQSDRWNPQIQRAYIKACAWADLSISRASS
jgi:EAL and modified HD-GYP domain-containing signal transduction protein